MTPVTSTDVGTDPPGTAGPTAIAQLDRARAPRRTATRGRPPAVLLVPAGLAATVAVAPLVYLAVRATEGGLGTVAEVLVRDRTVSLVLRSLALAGTVTAVCLVLGISLAGLVVRTRLPGRRVWGVLVVLPLAVPSYVAAFAWPSIFPRFGGFLGSTLVLSLCCYPYVYLPVAAALARIDPAHEEVSRSLGAGQVRTFLSVTVRQVRPAAAGGGLLVALYVLSDFGAVAMLRYDVFTRVIYTSYRSSFDLTPAAVLGCLLVLLTVLIVWGENRTRGRAGYARVGGGAARRRPPTELGGWAVLAVAWCGLVVSLALAVPLGALGYWLVQGASAGLDIAEVSTAAVSTLGVSALGATVAVALALPVGVIAARYRGRLARLLEQAAYAGHALPGIVVALSLVFLAVRYAQPIYQQLPVLVLAYVVLFMPAAVAAVRASVAQSPPRLEEVARSLGRSPAGVLRSVTVPLAGPGVAAGAALVFLTCMKELPATLMLQPIGMETLATELWGRTDVGAYAAAAPYGAALLLLAILPTALLDAPVGLDGRGFEGTTFDECGCAMSELVVRGVSKSFGTTPVLRGVDLTVPKGALAAVLGPSGCGKTTLLRIVAGFDTVDAGEVVIDGRVVSAPGSTVPPERRRVGMVPQEGALFPHLSVAGNVGFGLPRGQRSDRVDEMLELVGLGGYGTRMPAELSGGQQQRVALARALAPGPALVLLDEPFSALDTGLRAALREDVRRALHATGATAILVTHDQQEALSTADVVAVLQGGSIAQAGSPADLYRAPRDLDVATFVGEAVLLDAILRGGDAADCALGTLPVRVAGQAPGAPGTVVLRPEQLLLGPPGRGVPARVEGVVFYGHDSLVRLALADGSDSVSVTARIIGGHQLHPDDEVGLTVSGAASFFPS